MTFSVHIVQNNRNSHVYIRFRTYRINFAVCRDPIYPYPIYPVLYIINREALTSLETAVSWHWPVVGWGWTIRCPVFRRGDNFWWNNRYCWPLNSTLTPTTSSYTDKIYSTSSYYSSTSVAAVAVAVAGGCDRGGGGGGGGDGDGEYLKRDKWTKWWIW